MTDITPPPELVQQWLEELYGGPVSVISPFDQRVLIAAAQWGSDQELEACCEVLARELICDGKHVATDLRMIRRPKPPSLRERALQAWAAVEAGTDEDDQTAMAVIRRALEALPE